MKRLIVLLSILLTIPAFAGAATVADLEKQLNELRAEIEELSERIPDGLVLQRFTQLQADNRHRQAFGDIVEIAAKLRVFGWAGRVVVDRDAGSMEVHKTKHLSRSH